MVGYSKVENEFLRAESFDRTVMHFTKYKCSVPGRAVAIDLYLADLQLDISVQKRYPVSADLCLNRVYLYRSGSGR
jgi:hypothetical protein